MPDTYSFLLILRIALVAILYLVILQIVFVSRRKQRSDEDEIRDLAGEGCERGVLRVHEDEVRVHLSLDDAFERRGLTRIGFDGEDERHLIPRLRWGHL